MIVLSVNIILKALYGRLVLRIEGLLGSQETGGDSYDKQREIHIFTEWVATHYASCPVQALWWKD